jgi:hypothetical protein
MSEREARAARLDRTMQLGRDLAAAHEALTEAQAEFRRAEAAYNADMATTFAKAAG